MIEATKGKPCPYIKTLKLCQDTCARCEIYRKVKEGEK